MERQTYSAAQKAEIVRRVESGGSARVIAQELGINRNLISKWVKVAREAGTVDVLRSQGKPRGTNYDLNRYRRMLAAVRSENEALRQENERLKARA